MPYIAQSDRDQFETYECAFAERPITTAGELQYLIAMAIGSYFEENPYRYQNMNDIMGALAGAQMEFYRRHVGPYEDVCIRKNGDVQGYDPKTAGEQY